MEALVLLDETSDWAGTEHILALSENGKFQRTVVRQLPRVELTESSDPWARLQKSGIQQVRDFMDETRLTYAAAESQDRQRALAVLKRGYTVRSIASALIRYARAEGIKDVTLSKAETTESVYVTVLARPHGSSVGFLRHADGQNAYVNIRISGHGPIGRGGYTGFRQESKRILIDVNRKALREGGLALAFMRIRQIASTLRSVKERRGETLNISREESGPYAYGGRASGSTTDQEKHKDQKKLQRGQKKRRLARDWRSYWWWGADRVQERLDLKDRNRERIGRLRQRKGSAIPRHVRHRSTRIVR